VSVPVDIRLESLTKSLGSSILFSEEFAKLIDAPVQDLGDVYMIGSRV
jgi:hypothetical protein